MPHYPPTARVELAPFRHREEGGSATIAAPDRGLFLSVPVEALDLLLPLAEGRTVGEAVSRYQAAHGETPDVDDFLSVLAEEGFLEPAPAVTDRRDHPAGGSSWVGAIARCLFAPPLVCVAAIVVAAAAVLVATHPGLVPGSTVFLYPRHLIPLTLFMMAFVAAGVTVHELAHLLAARSAGVPARIGVGHRLWVVVAETDMTGIWLAPRSRRYLAFLAGPLVDALSASVLATLLFSARRGWVGLPPLAAQLVAAAFLTYLLRLLFECYLFVRTDFYYVIATALGCTSLLADTEAFLSGLVAGARRRISAGPGPAAASLPPGARERRAVHGYAVVWVLGRLAAFATLAVVGLPLLWRFLLLARLVVLGRPSPYGVADLVFLGSFAAGLQVAGLVMWIRSLLRARTARRARRERESDGLATQ